MEEKKKMGRPIKGTSLRDKKLTLRLSSEELELLAYCSEKTGLTRTDIIVKSVEKFKEKL